MEKDIEDIEQTIDLSIRQRDYYSAEYSLTICPECDWTLTKEGCTIILYAKSDTDETEFIINLTGSYLCNNCPVVVFDTDKLEQAVHIGIRGDRNIEYLVAGIFNLNAILKEKDIFKLVMQKI